MKKTYIAPTVLTVTLNCRSMMMIVSATDTLEGTSFGGDTDALGSTIDADVKGLSGRSVWDNEW